MISHYTLVAKLEANYVNRIGIKSLVAVHIDHRALSSDPCCHSDKNSEQDDYAIRLAEQIKQHLARLGESGPEEKSAESQENSRAKCQKIKNPKNQTVMTKMSARSNILGKHNSKFKTTLFGTNTKIIWASFPFEF